MKPQAFSGHTAIRGDTMFSVLIEGAAFCFSAGASEILQTIISRERGGSSKGDLIPGRVRSYSSELVSAPKYLSRASFICSRGTIVAFREVVITLPPISPYSTVCG
jgi:hypothetical protein